ncbi:hypothetical protein TVAG_383960 [Trichomonas vaginalis G3]|uniref:Uncharacterized protein n=1 Tax=Trichomonas vaginalis (strain ATCC PRA-98 / G3) TaxID=412133 RepID=A2F095_TRIV3|nr:hypothetical protein TVAGG3_0481080 [Trichomonas vaginalis G3]EAY01657.1 hypothetical protein TVAG_383960 [Trichomonas vaginalis G3]KAI5515712.1 hypothetical protein TVAGG3_0481080 [Trichomonas vaginalis G3]|eukprot:XP_001314250.1 hypothetical protein [Trichomonas vaginalis G3]
MTFNPIAEINAAKDNILSSISALSFVIDTGLDQIERYLFSYEINRRIQSRISNNNIYLKGKNIDMLKIKNKLLDNIKLNSEPPKPVAEIKKEPKEIAPKVEEPKKIPIKPVETKKPEIQLTKEELDRIKKLEEFLGSENIELKEIKKFQVPENYDPSEFYNIAMEFLNK